MTEIKNKFQIFIMNDFQVLEHNVMTNSVNCNTSDDLVIAYFWHFVKLFSFFDTNEKLCKLEVLFESEEKISLKYGQLAVQILQRNLFNSKLTRELLCKLGGFIKHANKL